MERKFGSLSSSVNPQELSKTVDGAMKLLGSLLALVGVLSTTEADTLVNQVGTLVTLGYAFFNGSIVIYGIIRKVVVNAQRKFGI